jgi:hypothetical protein
MRYVVTQHFIDPWTGKTVGFRRIGILSHAVQYK